MTASASDFGVNWSPVTQHVNLGTLLAGERQQNSATNSYKAVTRFGGRVHRLTAITSINLSGLLIGTAGAIGDTYISAITILKNAGAATATLVGFCADESGTPVSIVLTGLTTQDVTYSFDQMINYAAAASITAAVANTVLVWHGVP